VTASPGEVAAPWGRRVRRRAIAGGIEGGERLSWLCGGSAPDLAAAASGGGERRSAGAKGGSTREAHGGRPFIGDPRASSRPRDRRQRLGDVCVRTNGGRTDGPWRGARPASEGSPRGVQELQGRPRGTRPRSARGPDAEGGGRPRRGARGRVGVMTSRRGSVPAQRFHTRLLQARFSPKV
jgi:hypothetical protein